MSGNAWLRHQPQPLDAHSSPSGRRASSPSSSATPAPAVAVAAGGSYYSPAPHRGSPRALAPLTPSSLADGSSVGSPAAAEVHFSRLSPSADGGSGGRGRQQLLTPSRAAVMMMAPPATHRVASPLRAAIETDSVRAQVWRLCLLLAHPAPPRHCAVAAAVCLRSLHVGCAVAAPAAPLPPWP
jgi:hypothetical protein